MRIYSLERKQLIRSDLQKVWNFFSNPANLATITPPELNFITTSKQETDKIYTGQIITYTITPIAGIKLKWTTEIGEVQDKALFVDEQKKGPYKYWHHEHRFEQTKEGVLMTDKLIYALPLGILGRFARSLFVRKMVEQIFDYRYRKIEELFNGNK
jgi:ligand-binding SRPBCC domain-containing protein